MQRLQRVMARCVLSNARRRKVQREGSNTRQEKRPQNVTISEALFYVAIQENHFWPQKSRHDLIFVGHDVSFCVLILRRW